jgi:D-3-phosphoglycerate dehydrogenase / 2-oxoglutarate reductase
MKVLLADKLSEQAVSGIRELGCEVVFQPDVKAEELKDHVGDVQVLIVRSTKVGKETIQAAPDLSLIIRAGAGVNTIDVDAAGAQGIFVANCPGKNADAVAELVIRHIIAADRRIVDAAADLRAGSWKKKEYQKSAGLKGRTFGIIGFGTIGQKVVERVRALEMDILVWSRSMTPEKAKANNVRYAASPLEVAEQADVISVNIAATGETKHIADKQFFDKMKDGAVFINTSRGEVVDTEALKAAVREKGLRVGLDVFEGEPGSGTAAFEDTELAALVNGTPHIGASTSQASEAIANETLRVLKTFKETGFPANAVNVSPASTAKYSLIVRHLNRVGVLAGVLDALRGDNVNVEEMQNTIFSGGESACCALLLDDLPSDTTLDEIRKTEHIIIARLEKIDK